MPQATEQSEDALCPVHPPLRNIVRIVKNINIYGPSLAHITELANEFWVNGRMWQTFVVRDTIYSKTSLTDNLPRSTAPPISIALFGSQTSTHNDILTP